MKARRLMGCCVAFLIVTAAGCARHFSLGPFAQMDYGRSIAPGKQAFQRGDNEKSVDQFKKLKEKQGINYPLYLLFLGRAYMASGDFFDAQKSFLAAEKTLDETLTGAETGINLVVSDPQKIYRGRPEDGIMAHYSNALCFVKDRDYENAIIELKKSLLADKGKKAEQDADFSPVHYLMGISYGEMGLFDDALVALRSVTRCNPECAYGWYEAAKLARAQKNEDEYKRCIDKFRSLCPDSCLNSAPGKDGREEFVILLDCGYLGPPLSGMAGSFKKRKGSYAEKYARVYIDGVCAGRTYQLGDVGYQASTAGGRLMGKVARKVIGTVARQGLSLASFGASGMLTGGGEADMRFWETLP